MVKPEDEILPPARLIHLPDLHGSCNEPMPLMLAGGPDRLYVAEAFGYQVDRRHNCAGTALGGIYSIQLSTGSVTTLATYLPVKRMAVSPDGHDLYVLHSPDTAHNSPARLIHIDTATGRTGYQTTLDPGDWNLTLARIPVGLFPRGPVQVANSCP